MKVKEPTEREKAEKDWLAQIGLGIFCGMMKNPALEGRGSSFSGRIAFWV